MADESKYPTRIAPYGLRMPDELKQRVQAAAEANNRSMNAEIVATLEAMYPAKTEGELGEVMSAVMEDGRAREFVWDGRRAVVVSQKPGELRIVRTDLPIEELFEHLNDDRDEIMAADVKRRRNAEEG